MNYRIKAKLITFVMEELLTHIHKYELDISEDFSLKEKKERALFIIGEDSLIARLHSMSSKEDLERIVNTLKWSADYWEKMGCKNDYEVYNQLYVLLKKYT